jgi:predicted membrane protein
VNQLDSVWGNFWKVLQWKMLVYFMAIWSILRLFGIFMVIYYTLLSIGISLFFGLFYQENQLKQTSQPSPRERPSDGAHTIMSLHLRDD